MTSHHRPGLLALAALSALGAAPAMAQDDSYNYLGIGVGQARARIDDKRIVESLAGSGLTTDAVAHNERHSAYRVFGGHQFNRYFGMELGYFHLGTFGFNASTTPAGTLAGSFRVQGANLDLVGTMPITENFSGLARIGVQYARTRAEINGTGAVVVGNPRPSDREANAKIGLGVQYAVSPGFLVRGEVERFRLSDAVGNHPQVATYQVSLVFPFGRSAAPMRQAAAMPMMSEPAAPPPPPPAMAEPVAAPKAVQPVIVTGPGPLRRVSYSAESFFVFDRSELQPAGRQALDAFITQLRGASFEAITVQGFADRLGSAAYNQTLSLARADAVKAYLVGTGGMDANKIKTAGRSESEPVTLPDACKGPASPSVIACLQPDRRVELEVVGWR